MLILAKKVQKFHCSDQNLEGNHVDSTKRVKLIVSELEVCLISLQR
jgi:hypothetical protein